jgi:AcrR family transcriptional regulator
MAPRVILLLVKGHERELGSPASHTADEGATAGDSPHSSEGRRERKKSEVRAALRAAALRLVCERGLGAVTVEDITEAADVSKRTFFNYFLCKEDALVGFGLGLGPRIADEIVHRPVEEAPIEALHASFHQLVLEVEWSPERRLDWAARLRLVESYPSALLPRELAAFAELEQHVTQALTARPRADGGSDIFPAVLGAVAVAAARVAFKRWAQGNGGIPLPAMLDQVFELVEEGLSVPAGRCLPSGASRLPHH